jgi:hypothetical protein
MSELKRYELTEARFNNRHGTYVLYSDYVLLERENAQLREALRGTLELLRHAVKWADECNPAWINSDWRNGVLTDAAEVLKEKP